MDKMSHANCPMCAHKAYQEQVEKYVFGFYFSLKGSSVAEGREREVKLKTTLLCSGADGPKMHCRGDRELRLQRLIQSKTMDAGVSDFRFQIILSAPKPTKCGI